MRNLNAVEGKSSFNDATERWLRVLLIWLVARGLIAASVGIRIVIVSVESRVLSINEIVVLVAGLVALGIAAVWWFCANKLLRRRPYASVLVRTVLVLDALVSISYIFAALGFEGLIDRLVTYLAGGSHSIIEHTAVTDRMPLVQLLVIIIDIVFIRYLTVSEKARRLNETARR